MLPSPPHFFSSFLLGCALSLLIGAYFSRRSTWQRLFPKGSFQVYKKVGEYGEFDHYPFSWSPFNEPLNAWTSLIYTVCGVMVLICGISDSQVPAGEEHNNLVRAYLLSIFYGLSCMYLGVASFLFHASHAETWRKADAGMTSGVVISVVVFSIYDRFCPPAIVLPYFLCVAIVLQFSLTHGFLPYGSSDVLLPLLVAFIWGSELLPRYGGVVDSGEYGLWIECCYSVLVGFLLRIVDIKRSNPSIYKNILRLLMVLSIFPFCWALGMTDPVLVFGLFAWLTVCHSPYLGHIFWHFGLAGALFIWWYMLRVRPGDPSQSEGAKHDLSTISIIFFLVIKNALRRLAMVLPFAKKNQQDQCLYLLEHVFFACLGYYCIFYLPEHSPSDYDKGGYLFDTDAPALSRGASHQGSWVYNTKLCWLGSVYPSDFFHMYYLAKLGSHFEDVIYMSWRHFSASRTGIEKSTKLDHDVESDSLLTEDKGQKQERAEANHYFKLYHVGTAVMCYVSWLLRYTRIGSLIMFLHDVSDIPLDLVRLCGSFGFLNGQVVFMILTLLLWLYWRIYYFFSYVLYTVAFESRNTLQFSFYTPEQARFLVRGIFLVLLSSIFAMHCYWLYRMLAKTHRALVKG